MRNLFIFTIIIVMFSMWQFAKNLDDADIIKPDIQEVDFHVPPPTKAQTSHDKQKKKIEAMNQRLQEMTQKNDLNSNR